MKLTEELKKRIDTYFENVSSEELYQLAVVKYSFTELNVDLENEEFSTTPTIFYKSSYKSFFYSEMNEDNCDLSFAA